jgi:hypothetical protein
MRRDEKTGLEPDNQEAGGCDFERRKTGSSFRQHDLDLNIWGGSFMAETRLKAD